MALTPEEEKRLRDQIREELEERERRLSSAREKKEETRRERLETRLRNQIKEEEEEEYFTSKGYVRHKNRYGEVEWLPPEEAEQRKNRRRSSAKSASRQRQRHFRIARQWALNLGIVAVGLSVFLYLLQYRPATAAKLGSITVATDVPGAQVFFNGTEKQLFTPVTLNDLPAGKNYFISVYKDGFTTWPPMQRITVDANETEAVEFSLKNSASMGKVMVESNEDDYQLFVDGLPYRKTTDIIEIPTGYRIISVVKPGYAASPSYHRVVVNGEGVQRLAYEFSSMEDHGLIEVSSNQSSPYIYVDEKMVGLKANSPAFPIKPGIYEVRVRENGFRAHPPSEMVNIKPGEKISLSFHMQPEAMDTVQIVSAEPGASIMINGQWVPYVTPVSDFLLSKGDHYVNLMREGQLMRDKDIHVDVAVSDDNMIWLDW